MEPLASPAVPETGLGWRGISRAGLWELQIQVRRCVQSAGLEGSRHASRRSSNSDQVWRSPGPSLCQVWIQALKEVGSGLLRG